MVIGLIIIRVIANEAKRFVYHEYDWTTRSLITN